MNVDDVCRICLRLSHSTNAEFINIFVEEKGAHNIATMLTQVAAVQVNPDDRLPCAICSNCYDTLSAAFDFREQIIATDTELRRDLCKYDAEVVNCKVEEVDLEDVEYYEPVGFDYDTDTSVDNDASDVPDTSVIESNEHTNQETVPAEKNQKINNEVSIDNNTMTSDEFEHEISPIEEIQRKNFCVQCNKSFRNRYSFTIHSAKHTGIKPFRCNICNKGFAVRFGVTEHMRIHGIDQPYSCKECGETFRYANALSTHMRTHKREQSYKCKVCDKSFSRVAGLKVHEKTHTEEKPFICEVCSKSFKCLGNLKKHLTYHNTGKDHACPTCGKCFKNLICVQRHVKIHSSERRHVCNVCGKKFLARESLKIHTRIHDGVKPYSCKICGKLFTTMGCLPRHMRIHTGEMPYPCTVCPKRFSYSHHLLKHMKVHHPSKEIKN